MSDMRREPTPAFKSEAQRQSLVVATSEQERADQEFVNAVSDRDDWEGNHADSDDQGASRPDL
jgi:hypothetical protein